MNWSDTGRRALKTAVQTGLAILTADAVFGGFDLELYEQAATAAGAAAFAVVHNAVLGWASS